MKTLLALFSFILYITILMSVAGGSTPQIRGTYNSSGIAVGVYNELSDYIQIDTDTTNIEQHKETIITLAYTIWCRTKYYDEDPWIVGLEIWADYHHRSNPILLRNKIIASDTKGCWNNNKAVYEYPDDMLVAKSMLIAATIYGTTLDTVSQTALLLIRLKSIE